MNCDSLGANHLLSGAAVVQTVMPPSSCASSPHLRIAPPQLSSEIPRLSLYHLVSAAWSPVLLKKTPPIPVTFAIEPPLSRLCRQDLTLTQQSCTDKGDDYRDRQDLT